MARGLVVALGLALISGCGTTYQPRPSPRIGLVVHGGAAVYVANGHETPLSVLGGDLPDLVAGTPEAAAHARTARRQLAVGVPSYILGVGTVAVGIGLLSGPIGWVVISLGACVSGTGLGLMGAGFTHALDAVNLHNDSVSASREAATAPCSSAAGGCGSPARPRD